MCILSALPDIRGRGEAGIALVTAIFATILAALVMVGLGMMTMGSLGQSRQLSEHVGALPAIETGIDAYEFALQNDQVSDRNDYALTGTVIASLTDNGSLGSDVVALPNTHASIPSLSLIHI